MCWLGVPVWGGALRRAWHCLAATMPRSCCYPLMPHPLFSPCHPTHWPPNHTCAHPIPQGFSIALVLEYCLTDLRTLLVALRGGPPLDEAVAKALAQQLLQALARLHSCGWVHRDLAPSNILLAPDGTARLSDFGQARLLPGAPSANGYTAMGGGNDWAASVAEAVAEDTAAPAGSLTPGAALCTRWYKAPELLFNSRTYSAEVDLWGAGCVLAELLTGAPLFPGSSDIAQLALMSDLLGSIHEEEWPGVWTRQGMGGLWKW